MLQSESCVLVGPRVAACVVIKIQLDKKKSTVVLPFIFALVAEIA